MTEPAETADVVIVGAGPAGLAAARELRALGVGRVLVLDRERAAGGIPRHCDHPPFGLREFNRLMRGPAYARRLATAAEAAGAEIRTGATVAALRPGPLVEISTDAGLSTVAARAVLLATGVREKTRAARLIGGTKPGGVLSTGALQGLVHLDRLRPFRRPVVLGTELVAFSALLTCRHLGIRPVAMIEPGPRPTARWPAGLFPRLVGVPILLRTELVAIEGDERVTGVVVRDAGGGTRRIETDGVVVSGQFLPEASLVRTSHLALDPGSGGPAIDQYGRCSDPAFFAAGNLLRPVETAGWSWNEGRLVARSIARALAADLPSPAPGLAVVRMGDALKFALPQRLVGTPAADAPHRAFQLRVTRPAAGRLRLLLDGAEVWSEAVDLLPERRISVPLSAVPEGARGTLAFDLVETAR